MPETEKEVDATFFSIACTCFFIVLCFWIFGGLGELCIAL